MAESNVNTWHPSVNGRTQPGTEHLYDVMEHTVGSVPYYYVCIL